MLLFFAIRTILPGRAEPGDFDAENSRKAAVHGCNRPPSPPPPFSICENSKGHCDLSRRYLSPVNAICSEEVNFCAYHAHRIDMATGCSGWFVVYSLFAAVLVRGEHSFLPVLWHSWFVLMSLRQDDKLCCPAWASCNIESPSLKTRTTVFPSTRSWWDLIIPKYSSWYSWSRYEMAKYLKIQK